MNAKAIAQTEKLPWPATKEHRREIAQALRDTLGRSDIPEAHELLEALPQAEQYRKPPVSADSKIYLGEWRLDDDGVTLWTVRVRNKLIRHYYRVRFEKKDQRFVGSELGVQTVHGRGQADRVEQ